MNFYQRIDEQMKKCENSPENKASQVLYNKSDSLSRNPYYTQGMYSSLYISQLKWVGSQVRIQEAILVVLPRSGYSTKVNTWAYIKRLYTMAYILDYVPAYNKVYILDYIPCLYTKAIHKWIPKPISRSILDYYKSLYQKTVQKSY